MRALLLVRPPPDAERRALAAGLRSARAPILPASGRGEHTPAIAAALGCSDQTVRDAIHAFDRTGVAAPTPDSKRPHRRHPAFDAADADRPRGLLHRSPRDFGHPASLRTLELAAATAAAEGLTATRVTGETVRATLARLGIGRKRAKRWITGPDPAYARKKAVATA